MMKFNSQAVRLPQRAAAIASRLTVAGVIALAASATALPVLAQGHPDHRGGHSMGGGHHGMFSGSPQHIDRAVDHMLVGLNTTDAQRSQIKQIAQAAATDLKAQRESAGSLREKGQAIFAAPTVDARAAEDLRQQMLAQHDQSSKRMVQAMLDVSNVLTPEQRAAIGERIKERRAMRDERMKRWHGERKQP